MSNCSRSDAPAGGNEPVPHWPVVVVGAGQAGLSMSRQLAVRGIRHRLFERERIGHAWRAQRWDSFCLVTPNWQCRLPDFPYAGPDPEGFMLRDQIVAYIEAFARHVEAPVSEGVAVERVRPADAGFALETSQGPCTADAVVMATSAYHRPSVPAMAAELPDRLCQIHSSAYRNPEQLPAGAVLVVGSGQSGCQIAEDLLLAGRTVHLVTGSAPRAPRTYRGREGVAWLEEMGQYALTVDQHPLKEGVRRNANHYLTGRDGGRDIDLRAFALQGMRLYGRLTGIADGILTFADDLAANLDRADTVYTGIQAAIDRHIAERGIDAPPQAHYRPVWRPDCTVTELDLGVAGIASVVWATGFRTDFSLVDADIFDARGLPAHRRGVTRVPGLYFVGLPWLWTWGSGRFSGIAADTTHVADHLADQLRSRTEQRGAA
jgi:putative flavoprotein involved in K+ transport